MNSFSKLLVMIYSLILVNFTGQSQDYLQKLSRAALELIQQGNSCEAVERDDCKQYYLSAVKTAKDSDSCVACAITELARFEINQGNLESGEKYLGLSMRLVGTPSKADTLLWNLKAENFTLFAMAAYIKGDMVAAMDYLLENAKITEQFGDPKVAALIKVNVSSIHASMGNLEEAIRYGLMAHEELVKHDDKRYATLSSNLASFYFENNNIKEAQQWARKAVFFGKQHDFVNPIASGYNVLASIHGVSNPDSSLYYSTQAIELAKTSNIPRIYAGALHVHGQTLNKLGRYAEAQGFIEKSLEIYIELNDADQFNVYRTAAKNALSFGMYEKAANYLDQVLFYKDSVISIENREITNELLQKYESEKKDKELAESQLIIREKETSRKITLISSILGFVIFTLLLIVLRARYIKGIQKLQ
jgi:tetratricopeptide (TPR) repeat protein